MIVQNLSAWRAWALVILGVGTVCLPETHAQSRREMELARQRLVNQEIEGAGITNKRVIQSIRETPRHEFVPLHLRRLSYVDAALPIGEQQTISPPFIVAFMTQALDPQPTDKVLEIGTGSGYQAAVLSPLVKEVYTIEIVEKLGRKAAKTLKKLGYRNITTKVGDGFAGWPAHAPFDKIIVTCSPEKVPVPLVQQLREGGRMVIPLGRRYQQTMYLLKKEEGKLVPEALRSTLFVPMTGQAEELRQAQPDPTNPQIVNGSFEQSLEEKAAQDNTPATDSQAEKFPAGWHYFQRAKLVDDKLAPNGQRYVTFSNDVPGRLARTVQGFALDGREIGQLAIAAWVKADDVRPGRKPDQLAVIVVSFFGENREPIGEDWIGPWFDTFEWTEKTGRLRVPQKARSAILQMGLLGGTGEASFDHLRIKAIPRTK